MGRDDREPWSPGDYIGYGILVAVAAGILAAVVGGTASVDAGRWLFAVGGGVAGVMITIGVIAHAVHVGIRHSR